MMTLSLRRWDSKASLLAYLSGRHSAPLILGDGCEAPREFWSVSLPDSSPPLEFGILTSGPGPKPSAVRLDSGDALFVGHENSVSVISLRCKAICHEYEIEGVFFDFVNTKETSVVAIHELGAIALDNSGKLLWRFSAHDIVKGWRMTAEHLLIQTQGSEDEEAVSLDTGLRTRLLT